MTADSSNLELDTADNLRITDRVQQIAATRAVIDQAKGMLMFICGIDAEAAFGLLRQHSQHHNVKLALLAQQIVGDLLELSKSKPTLDRIDSHGLLVTAHLRIADVAARQADGQSKTQQSPLMSDSVKCGY